MKLYSALGVAALAIIAFLAYLVYDWFGNCDDSSGLCGALHGNLSKDPSTGQSNGLLNNLNTAVFGGNFPGGGEVSGTSETYTGAALTTLEHPFDTIRSIFSSK